MSRWRIALVVLLVAAPLGILAAAGSYYLWVSGLGFAVWWPMAACMALGYLLGWYWQRKKQLLRPVVEEPLPHWTERDHQAWQLVEARARASEKLDPNQLAAFQFYVDTGQEMALELARFYHPGATDPVGSLTIPEILAVIELASHDLAQMVDEYLPGGHLLTVNDWKRCRQVADWYKTANAAYWAVSAVFAPINTAIRYTAARVGLSGPFQMLQQNLLLWFYTAFVHRLGTYLIDLNSGRLRVGASRYRAIMGTSVPVQDQGATPDDRPTDAEPRAVTLTLFGQTKVGKSSLINALLGEQKALVDVLPATAEVARYALQPTGIPARLELLDTVGYGHAGPRADHVKATRAAAQQSDLLLLVLHARNPGRQADLEMLKELREWFASHPELRRPPVLAVLTHVDLLSPAMEWSPPYNWQQPQRPKEQNIAQAVQAVREQLGDYLAGVVPVCTTAGKVWGVEEALLPAVSELLDEAHAVALLRCLRNEADANKVRKVFHQLAAAGKQLVRMAWEGPLK